MSTDSLVRPFSLAPKTKSTKLTHFPKGEEDLLRAYHLVSLDVKKFSPNYVIAHFFLDYCMEWLVLTVMCQNQLFLGRKSISTLEIRVLKVLDIEVFK